MRGSLRVEIILVSFIVILFSLCIMNANAQTYTVKITADPGTILAGGDTSVITAQLYQDGAPAHISGIVVYFDQSDASKGDLQSSSVSTDTNGAATTYYTSKANDGSTSIRAYITSSQDGSILAQDNVQLSIVISGSISGIIEDSKGNLIPYANVSLWQNGQLVRIPENPQQSGDGRGIALGSYNYYRVPLGQYTVTAEKEGHKLSVSINLVGNGVTADIALSDYTYNAPATPTPTPGQSANPTNNDQITPIDVPTQTSVSSPSVSPSTAQTPTPTIIASAVSQQPASSTSAPAGSSNGQFYNGMIFGAGILISILAILGIGIGIGFLVFRRK